MHTNCAGFGRGGGGVLMPVWGRIALYFLLDVCDEDVVGAAGAVAADGTFGLQLQYVPICQVPCGQSFALVQN